MIDLINGNLDLSGGTLLSLCEEFRKNNRIDPQKFEQYGVKRGLRNADGSGVMAGLTQICNVHGLCAQRRGEIPRARTADLPGN